MDLVNGLVMFDQIDVKSDGQWLDSTQTNSNMDHLVLVD